MEKVLVQQGTEFTPHVTLDSVNGEITLKGKILTNDCDAIFQPIFNWLDEYAKVPVPKTLINIKLDYFDTLSTKYLVNLLKKIETDLSTLSELKVKWFYDVDDEDMFEIAEDFEAIINIPFELEGIKGNWSILDN